MHKLYPLLLAFLLFACAPSASVTTYSARAPLEYYVLNPEVPLYDAPASVVPKLTLSQGEKLLVVGRQRPRWFVVKREGVTYYVVEDALSLAPPAPSTTSTTASPVAPVAPSSSSGSYHNVQTGPRGGQYYINKNGNKTYLKRK